MLLKVTYCVVNISIHIRRLRTFPWNKASKEPLNHVFRTRRINVIFDKCIPALVHLSRCSNLHLHVVSLQIQAFLKQIQAFIISQRHKQTFHYTKTMQIGRQFIFSVFCRPFLALHSQSAKTNSELFTTKFTANNAAFFFAPITNYNSSSKINLQVQRYERKQDVWKKKPRNLIAFERPKILSKGRNI